MLVQTDNQTPMSATAKEKPKLPLREIQDKNCWLWLRNAFKNVPKVKQIIKSMRYMFVNCLTENKVLPTEKQSQVPIFNIITPKSLAVVSS